MSSSKYLFKGAP